jgi:hypothetical protein
MTTTSRDTTAADDDTVHPSGDPFLHFRQPREHDPFGGLWIVRRRNGWRLFAAVNSPWLRFLVG